MCKPHHRGRALPNGHFLTHPILLCQTRSAISGSGLCPPVAVDAVRVGLPAAPCRALGRLSRQLGPGSEEIFEVELVAAALRMNRGRFLADSAGRGSRNGCLAGRGVEGRR